MQTAVLEKQKLSWEEFYATEFPEDGIKRELIDGEARMTPAPNVRHKRIQNFLMAWFEEFSKKFPQYEAFTEFNLKLGDNFYIPDFAILRSTEQGGPCRFTEVYAEGPPDVVAEVLSPGSEQRDVWEKRFEYEQAGVPEYWIFDPKRKRALILRLQEGCYHEVFSGGEGAYACASVPGLLLDVGPLFLKA